MVTYFGTEVQTFRGNEVRDVRARLLSRGLVCLVGEVTVESALEVWLKLEYLRLEGRVPTLAIDSPGGDLRAGLALCDLLQSAGNVRTVAIARAYSVAALIFSCGKRGERAILPHAQVMIHEPLIEQMGGSASSVQERASALLFAKDEIARLLAKTCGHSEEEISEKLRTDTFFHAEEAVAFGIADKVLSGIEFEKEVCL